MQGLNDIKAEAFRCLSRGVADRRSPFRHPALGTIADGRPSVRTVVLRAWDAGLRRITVHSDIRAAKIAEVAAMAAVSLHVWDPGHLVQLRLDGEAMRAGPERAAAEWARLHAGSRATYATEPQPGSVIDDPADLSRNEAQAFAHFAVLDITIGAFEWLHLAADGHRRARFTWAEAWQGVWLVP